MMKACTIPLALLACLALDVHAAVQPGPEQDKAAVKEAVRLQVFLDRANFGPGKIDGHYGDFTRKALALYRQAQGSTQPIAELTNQGAKAVKQKPKGREQLPPP